MLNEKAYNTPMLNLLGELVSLRDILILMSKSSASDLYMKVGEKVILKLSEGITRLDSEVLKQSHLQFVISCFLTSIETERFRKNREVDLVHTDGSSRFRIHIGTASSGDYVVIRRIAQQIRELKDLGLPVKAVTRLTNISNGLVLIAGATGQGKTVTAVALIDQIARLRGATVLTLEDPIEFIFQDYKGLFIQREVGMHVTSFASGVRSALRENLDVIYVGEMRDPETIDEVLKASEMGHLVVTTIHADDSISALGRIMGSMQEKDQSRIRYTLSAGLSAIIYQRLLPSTRRDQRVLCSEVIFPTTAIRSVLRGGDLNKLSMYLGMPGSGVTYQEHLQELFSFQSITTQTWNRENSEHLERMGGVVAPDEPMS